MGTRLAAEGLTAFGPCKTNHAQATGKRVGEYPRKEAIAMFDVLRKLVRDEAGQDLAEYGIALAVIAGGLGLVAVAISTDVNTLWTRAQTEINDAATSAS
jgi:Flp pilus assembly pilin Flp